MKTLKYIYILSALWFITASVSSCSSDFLNTEVKTYVTQEQFEKSVTADPNQLNAILSGIYGYMGESWVSLGANGWHFDYSFMNILRVIDVMGNDVALSVVIDGDWYYSFHIHEYYGSPYVYTAAIWTPLYTMAANASSIISSTPDYDSAADDLKATAGQAYAIRALSFYYLVNLYQHTYGEANLNKPSIPLPLSSHEESIMARATVKQVFDQIESDLDKAIQIPISYKRPSKNNIDNSVAYGIYARYCLSRGGKGETATERAYLNKAIEYAKEAKIAYDISTINPTSVDNVVGDGYGNIKASNVMWGLGINAQMETGIVSFFSFYSSLIGEAGYSNYTGHSYIDKSLFDQIPDSDVRKKLFVGTEGDVGYPAKNSSTGEEYPYVVPQYANVKFGKIKTVEDWLYDYIFMRVEEMILIEAEAHALLGDEANAALALKPLMEKRISGWDEAIVTADEVFLQRRIELWGEGFGILDNKRLNLEVNRDYPGSNHSPLTLENLPAQSNKLLYQIPLKEIDNNKEIVIDNN